MFGCMSVWPYALSGAIFGATYLGLKTLTGGGSFGATTVQGPFDAVILAPLLLCIVIAVIIGWAQERWAARRGRTLPTDPTA
jgi:hypothetical protein